MRRPASIRPALLLAGATLFLATLLGPSALAHPRHGHGPHGHPVRRSTVVVAPAPLYLHPAPPRAAFLVPRRIVVADRGRYRAYDRGLVWYAPHGHYHSVYAFPVFVDGRWISRPHVYCDGALVVGGNVTFQGSRFTVSVGF